MHTAEQCRNRIEVGASRLGLIVAALAMCVLMLVSPDGHAQGDGPRSQLPMPVGTNVFAPTWLDLSMNSDFSQSILLADVDVKADILLGIYVRSFAVGDRYAQVWVVPNWGDIDGTLQVERDTGGSIDRSVHESGFGDPYFAFKVGLVGSPALDLGGFMKHKPTFQLYAYGGVFAPVGDYEDDRLLNIGTNRWAWRLGLPMVIPLGDPRTQTYLEIHPGITLYGDNDDPTGGADLKEQDTLYQVEFHLSRNFTPKLWGSIGGRYRNGGETTTDGIADDNRQDVLGGELTLGYAFTPHLGLQSTYGQVVSESDGSKSDMLRVRLTYAF
jgi:hypothetical protein